MRMISLAAVATLAITSATPVLAQIVPGERTVTNLDSPTPVGQSWGVIPGENTNGGSGQITSQNVSDTDGSLNVTGDRARVQTGIQYGGGTNSGVSANSIQQLTADYFVNALGTNALATPALRVLIQDGSQRSELIWEGAYNGNSGLGAGSADTNDRFYQFIAGLGTTMNPDSPGAYVFRSLSDWGNLYSSNAFVSGLSIGAGSGFGAGFSANVDNLQFVTDAGTTRFNFAAQSAVPEPSTWALMLLGFGGMGVAMRRQRRSAALKIQAA